jgi:glycosyltransferase involved in cell wall biosynthesis
MSSAFLGNDGTAVRQTPAARRLRVLVLRSCRPAQFAAAVAGVRQRHPDAEIVALSHCGHRESLTAAGVDRIVEIPSTRFGILRLRRVDLRRLRQERFDEAVIPQMTAHHEGHGNLYRVVAAIGARAVTVIRGDDEPFVFNARPFLRYTAKVTCLEAFVWVQRPPFLLALLVAACGVPRRTPEPKGRRRVLHIISSLGVGGAQRQLAELVNRTPADVYDVDVLVLGSFDGEFARHWFARSDVRVRYLSEWPRLVSSVLEVRRICAAGKYDVVHTWLFMANVIGVAGARLARTPRVIASVRNLSLWKRTWYRQWWFRAADVLSARAADVVTVNAEALVEDHAGWACYPADRIHVVHNGLDPALFRLDRREARSSLLAVAGLPDEAIVIGTVGRMAPEKDHATFLKVIQAVRQVRADVHAVVVGDGQLRQHLEAEAAALGIADAVAFVGERTDARRLMAGFDVFVLTSTIEGFPNVLLEAAFLGVPAIASRVGGSPDVLANPDDTFLAADASAAAQRLLALIDAPAAARENAERSRERALALFTADRTASRWFDLYTPSGAAPLTELAHDASSSLTPSSLSAS